MIFVLVGLGKWGQNYLRAVKQLSDTKIKYVCSGAHSTKNLSPEYIKVENYRDLIKKKDIDGVIIAVPASKHYELAEFFLRIGKPILIEKPLVTSLDQAKKLKDIFERTKGKILVGNIFLYNKAFQKLIELSGSVGHIQYLHFEGCDFGPVRNDVSCLWDWGPHDISMCLAIMKKMPLEVSAWAVKILRPKTDRYDMVYARLLFENNISAFIRIGWLSPFKRRQALLVGEKGSLLFDDTSKKKLLRFNLGKGREISYPKYQWIEPLILEISDFIEMIKNSKEPESNFSKSFNVIKIIDAIERAIRLNTTIRL